MSKPKTFETSTTKRILTGTAIAAVLAYGGIRLQQIDQADKLGPVQYHADHTDGPPGGNQDSSVESGK